MLKILQPEGWVKPKSYANGVEARGRLVFCRRPDRLEHRLRMGDRRFRRTDAADAEKRDCRGGSGGRRAEHIVSMTWFFTSKAEYLASLKALGRSGARRWAVTIIRIAAVEVAALVEDRAKDRDPGQAVIPD